MGGGGGGGGRILLVTIADVHFPVTLEVIHQVNAAFPAAIMGGWSVYIELAVFQVFAMCGHVTKLIIFQKQGKDQVNLAI